MAKKTTVAAKCKNYKIHLAEIEKNPLHSTPLFIRTDMAIHYGWEKIEGEWLCPECIKAEGNWGLQGDMV